MRERVRYIAIDALHGISCHQSVDDSFFNGLYRAFYQWGDLVVRELFYTYHFFPVKRAGIGG